MLSAFITGSCGIVLAYLIGHGVLGLSMGEVLICVGVTELAALFSTLGVLKLERTPWVRKNVLKSSPRTWVVFLTLFFGPIILLGPGLTQPKNFLWMVLPLIMCTGYAIIVMGPIQDSIVRRIQRQGR